MVVFDVLCPLGHRTEVHLPSMFSEDPECGDCGRETQRVPGFAGMSGTASPGPSRDDMPHTWKGINKGDPETVRHWHTAMTKREKLEASYPDLAGDRRPVLAHEGAFAANPLRAGDPLAAKVSEATFGKKEPSRPGSSTSATSTPRKDLPS